jgi:glutathione S-transferase
MITLYELMPSGHCHKVRMMLSFLGLEYESYVVKASEKEHKQPPFLGMNPFGQVPVLVDGDACIRDSQAILVYLARQYGDDKWLPQDARGLAAVTPWLFTAANEIARGPGTARLRLKFDAQVDYENALKVSDEIIAIMESHLKQNEWLALSRPTVADVACYPYLALAKEGGIDLQNHPGIQAWFARIRALPGYVGMEGM